MCYLLHSAMSNQSTPHCLQRSFLSLSLSPHLVSSFDSLTKHKTRKGFNELLISTCLIYHFSVILYLERRIVFRYCHTHLTYMNPASVRTVVWMNFYFIGVCVLFVFFFRLSIVHFFRFAHDCFICLSVFYGCACIWRYNFVVGILLIMRRLMQILLC